MPSFPNINTLTQKLNLSGNETIQISATERTLLSAIASLALGRPLTGFSDSEDVDIYANEIKSTDTILEAIQKIMARLGKNTYALYPFEDAFGEENTGIVGYIRQDEDHELLFALDWDSEGYLSVVHKVHQPQGTSLTPDDILRILDQEGKFKILNNVETFTSSTNTGGSISIYPNRASVEFFSGGVSSLLLKASNWNSDTAHISGDSNTVFVTNSNILKSYFTVVNDVQGLTLVPYFSENFDTDPGTTLQAIAVQVFRTGTTIVLLINKCGYEAAQ